MKKKLIISVLAVALVLCCAIGATFAWLVSTPRSVVNTFTVGDITIDLKEHKYDVDKNELINADSFDSNNLVTENSNYKMVPGRVLPKDPFVKISGSSEPCWVFVKVEELNNLTDFIEYKIDEKTLETPGWTKLDGVNGVYYFDYSRSGSDTTINILAGTIVTVKSTVTKDDLSKIEDNAKPQLKFTAYAIQKDGFATATLAWEEVSKAN